MAKGFYSLPLRSDTEVIRLHGRTGFKAVLTLLFDSLGGFKFLLTGPLGKKKGLESNAALQPLLCTCVRAFENNPLSVRRARDMAFP